MKTVSLRAAAAALLLGVCGCFYEHREYTPELKIANREFAAFGDFGNLELVDRVDCGDFISREYVEYPSGATRVENILGSQCRVMPNENDKIKYFSYLIGKGKGLKAGQPYLLVLEYPEDASRAFHVTVGGCEGTLGVATGQASGDAVKNYMVDNNVESLKYPLSGKYKQLEIFFVMQDNLTGYMMNDRRYRNPDEGFFVTVNQYEQAQDPLSKGAAVKSIALYKFKDFKAALPKIVYPEDGLPRRYLFWREEMADGAVVEPWNSAEKNTYRMAMNDPVDWYRSKIAMLRFLGMNTFSRDLLEFGNNQGWDPDKYGGNNWYYKSTFDGRWQDILEMMKNENPDIYILPYYEYCGSVGADPALAIGPQRRAIRPDGSGRYTDVGWLRGNIDFADPDSLTDTEKLLDCTVTQFKDLGNFIGVWFRPRMEANPVSFSDKAIAQYNAEKKTAYTRSDFAADPKLEQEYSVWFRSRRRQWLLGVRNYMRKNVNPDAAVLYTADYRDPGVNLQNVRNPGGKPVIVTDEPAMWNKMLASDIYRNARKRADFEGISARSYDETVKNADHLAAIYAVPRRHEDDRPIKADSTTRWDLAHMPADPATYAADPGVLVTYTFNRLYTVSNPAMFADFRNGDGEAAAVRHYGLNEHDMGPYGDSIVGSYFSMVDRGEPYTMLAEARLLAYGDPRYIAYLTPSNMMRGAPRQVREFNRAFLALPAVPGRIIYDRGGLVVREYPTVHGSYFALINTSMDTLQEKIAIPGKGRLSDRLSGEPMLTDSEGRIEVKLEPAQVKVLKRSN